MVVMLDCVGADLDLGTAREIGYDNAQVLSVYGLRAEFRTLGIEGVVNLMIKRSVVMCMEVGDLVERLVKDWGDVGAERL